MKFYHGTTLQNAIRIAEMGFLPRKGAVWFTTSKQYAQGRAKQKARRTGSSPFVLNCEIDVSELYNRLGKKLVMRGGGVLAIRGTGPADSNTLTFYVRVAQFARTDCQVGEPETWTQILRRY